MDHEENIRKVLKGEDDIRLAYFYGSRAVGRDHEDSDYDIGLVVEDVKNFDIHRVSELSDRIERFLDNRVDLRVLNGKDIRFVYNVLKEGGPIYVEDEDFRQRFEVRTMKEYMDMKPFLDEYDRNVKERVTG